MPDFNDAPKPGDLIPVGTVLTVQLTIRPGGYGEGSLFKRSDTGAEMLDCEFVVVTPGQYEKRKFWQLFILNGTTKGHTDMAERSRGMIRAMLESAQYPSRRCHGRSHQSPQCRLAGSAKPALHGEARHRTRQDRSL
jgi:hypothetical protein